MVKSDYIVYSRTVGQYKVGQFVLSDSIDLIGRTVQSYCRTV